MDAAMACLLAQKKMLGHDHNPKSPILPPISSGFSKAGPAVDEEEEEEVANSALSAFRAKEEEIQKRKMEVKEKVQTQLGRVVEESKRLAEIRESLLALEDPKRKEVTNLRKKINSVTKELKSLGHTKQKKEMEYTEATAALNAKKKERTELISKFMEMVRESEKLRLKKLEELSKDVETSTPSD